MISGADLAIGTKFYFNDELVEVVECKKHGGCSECIFDCESAECCFYFECNSCDRKDKKDVYFKKIEE